MDVAVLPGVEASVWTPQARLWQGPEKGPGPSLGFLAGFLFLSSGGFFLRKQLGEEWKCVFCFVWMGVGAGFQAAVQFPASGSFSSTVSTCLVLHDSQAWGLWLLGGEPAAPGPVLTTGRQNHFRFGCVMRPGHRACLGVHTQAVPLASTVAVAWRRLRGGGAPCVHVCCPLLEWAHPPQGDVRPYRIQGHP